MDINEFINTETKSDVKECHKRTKEILPFLSGLTIKEQHVVIYGAIGHIYANLRFSGDKEQAEFYLASFARGMYEVYKNRDDFYSLMEKEKKEKINLQGL